MDVHELVSALKRLAKELGRTPTSREYEAQCGISSRLIRKHKYSELCKMAGIEPNQRPQDVNPEEIRPPRILAFDIETAPLEVYVFQLAGNDYISTSNIKRDSFILSFAARFLDKKKIHYIDNKSGRDKSNDEKIIRFAHKLFMEADILLGHNIDRFDIKKLNARFVYYGLPPVPKKTTIDTLKIAKRYFSFTSNKLEYLAKFLKCDEKLTDRKYQGLLLWTACLNNDKVAYEELKAYNCQDVETQIQVFEKLKSYDHNLNFQAYTQKPVCICGNTFFSKDGIAYTKFGAYQRYKCAQCGKFMTGKHNLIPKSAREQFFK